MKVLAEGKTGVLAGGNEWSMEKTKGYLDGETARRRGSQPTLYAMVGIDDYCLGFRAAYFERQPQDSTRAGNRNGAQQLPALLRTGAVAASTAPSEYPHFATT